METSLNSKSMTNKFSLLRMKQEEEESTLLLLSQEPITFLSRELITLLIVRENLNNWHVTSKP